MRSIHYIVVLLIAIFRGKKGGKGGDPLSESNNTLARTCYMIDNDRGNLHFLTVLVIESRFKRSFRKQNLALVDILYKSYETR